MILQVAGVIGVEPWTYTIRELWAMHIGALEERWWHTANIMATIHNSQISKRNQVKSPADFHPLERNKRRAAQVSAKEGVQYLTRALISASDE